MESIDDFLPFPASLLVALATIVFLLHRIWPRLSHHTPSKVLKTVPIAIELPTHSNLTVSKEPDLPEGWWTGRDIFELERRALFSQVMHIAWNSSNCH
jgi:hypothetical protein